MIPSLSDTAMGSLSGGVGGAMLGTWCGGRWKGKVGKRRFARFSLIILPLGEMTWPSGDKYIGDWEDDRRNGHGLYLYTSGNRYKGQYVLRKKVG